MFKTSTLAILVAVPVLSNAQCDGCNPGSTPVDPPVDTSTPSACDGYVGQATLADLDATPRSRPDLEQLAIYLDGTFTARQSTYDRLLADTAAAAALHEDVVGIGYRSPFAHDTLLVGGTAATKPAMADGTFDAWDCENDWYGLNEIRVHSGFVALVFPGTFDMTALAAEYSDIPGVSYAEPDARIGGGSSVCANPDGDVWHYVYDIGSGDCPSGCIDHQYVYFVSQADGTVTHEGSWNSNAPIGTRPAWVDLFDCP